MAFGSLRARQVRRATSACAMGALARVSSDVVVEVLAFLDIESVLQVGGACASLPTMCARHVSMQHTIIAPRPPEVP